MKFATAFFKLTFEFLWWTLVHFVWNPIKWVTTGTYTAIKNRKKKPTWKADKAASKAQAAAAADLPKLTKRAEELTAKMKKLSDEYDELSVELKLCTSLIHAAGGDFGQHKKPQQNNQQKQKGNQNNQQNNRNNKQPVIQNG